MKTSYIEMFLNNEMGNLSGKYKGFADVSAEKKTSNRLSVDNERWDSPNRYRKKDVSIEKVIFNKDQESN